MKWVQQDATIAFFYSQWLYSTCFGWQSHPSSGVQCCIWPLSPETCRVKPLRIKNAIVASCWTYFTTVLAVCQSCIMRADWASVPHNFVQCYWVLFQGTKFAETPHHKHLSITQSQEEMNIFSCSEMKECWMIMQINPTRCTILFNIFIYLSSLYVSGGDRSGTLVKVLCFKSEGRWFDSRWCHWNVYWHNPPDRTMALGSTQPLTEVCTRRISWG